jgi:hypothetical protein
MSPSPRRRPSLQRCRRRCPWADPRVVGAAGSRLEARGWSTAVIAKQVVGHHECVSSYSPPARRTTPAVLTPASRPGRRALLYVWRGYAYRTLRARRAPRFHVPTDLAAGTLSALLLANLRARGLSALLAQPGDRLVVALWHQLGCGVDADGASPKCACPSRHLCRPSKRPGAAAGVTEQPPRCRRQGGC